MGLFEGPWSESDLLQLIKLREQRVKEGADRLQAARAKEIQEAAEARRSGAAKYPGIPMPRVDTARAWTGVAGEPPTGVMRGDDRMMKQVYVQAKDVHKIFKDVEYTPGRYRVRATYKGSVFEADAYTMSNGGWWTIISGSEDRRRGRAIPTNGDDLMKKFTDKVLLQGQYDDLEKIKTPSPGEQFDMNQLAVAAVLTLNKMVEVINEQSEKIAELEGLIIAQQSQPPASAEPAFKLTKIGDSYEDVRAVG
jgi:hypothetical protein